VHNLSHLSHQKVKKVKPQNKLKTNIVFTNNEMIDDEIVMVLGKKCCSSQCLSNIDLVHARKFFYQFHLDKFQKHEKIRLLLQSCKVISPTLTSHTICGMNFGLKFELEIGSFFEVCPTAFKKLTHIGMTTLELLANDNMKIDDIHIVAKTVKMKKIDICREFIMTFILPICDIDESYPIYLRCDAYSSPKDILPSFTDYLKEHFASEDKYSYCSESTFNSTLRKHFSNILFGESGFCGECFTYDSQIRILKDSIKKLEIEGKKINQNKINQNQILMKKWENTKMEHKSRATALRALSNQYGYDV
jgi:hypothetical protein